ncbi:hypothetical protein SUGI_0623500, partial [Cryptomeria japonica]
AYSHQFLFVTVQEFGSYKRRIHNGQITTDGSVVTDPDTVLRIGSKLVYHRLPWREPLAPYEVGILYEDDQLLIVNKPSGLQVLPGGLFQQRTLLNQLQWRTDKSGEYGPEVSSTVNTLQESYPVPVHRLGRGTSGILLCAKTNVAKSKLSADFADGTFSIRSNRCSGTDPCDVKRRISKTYRALAKGIIQQEKILIQQPIGKMQYPGVGGGLYAASPTGKPSESRISVLSRDENRNCTLVEVEIYSGRPHQIRIHLSYIGHPLVGDPLYVAGGRPSISLSEKCSERYDVENFAEDGGYEKPLNALPGDCGYHLHASRLLFHHPASDEDIQIFAPSPPMLRTSEENASIDNKF